MKRILGLLLLALLLCGCTEPLPEETTAPPATMLAPTETTAPVGTYLPESETEIRTGGAVRCYEAEDSCYGIRMIDEDVLAFSGEEKTVLTRLTGDNLYPLAGAQLDCRVEPSDPTFQVSSNGITYYNPDTREVVFLDNNLKEVRRLGMSADMVGKPILSSNRMQVYYCTADAVRVYDITAGIDKLLKSISYPEQSVEDILLNDSVLRCSLLDQTGAEYTIFISTKTGQLLSQILSGVEVSAYGDMYYARVPEGVQEVLAFGRAGEEPRVLNPRDPFAMRWYLTASNSAVTGTMEKTATYLDHYDLETGRRTAAVELPSGMEPRYIEHHPDTGAIVIMAYDHMADSPVLLSWLPEKTPVEDAAVYMGPRYTAEQPDTAGLSECAALAQSIGAKYGLQILVGADAVANQPWDYTLELEYQTSIIRKQLKTLEKALANFPQGFFDKVYGDATICIVREIRGNAVSGSLESASGVQFWDGEKAYVALAAGDTLTGAFFHEIFHVLDSKILSETRIYYQWDDLNPEGCEYFEDYSSYLSADVSQYLREEDRVFIDAYSMCYPKEDRARIMEYACQPGNAHYFQSEVMQSKLYKLCEGIRRAFHLEKSQETFLWEQYLHEPMKIK